MNIQVIAIGKIREKYIKLGIDEFLKRIQPYSSIKVTEIEAATLKYESRQDKGLEIESEKILNQIPETAYVIVMDIKAKQLSSEKLASKIKEINLNGINQLVFVIGGAIGLSDIIKGRADLLLSMSEMTFPHQLARLMLLEQIYRAFKIINNEPYHK